MTMAAKVSISLTEQMMTEINQRIETGAYTSVSEVIRAGLRSLSRDEEEHEERLKSIRDRVQEAIDDPRPRLNSQQMRAHLDDLYAKHADKA